MTTEIIFAGFGGQGVILAGKILTLAGMSEDKYVSHIPSYGAEMRGGTANCSVIVSDEEVASPVIEKPDVVVALNKPSMTKFEKWLKPGGLLIYNSSLIDIEPSRKDIRTLALPANDMAAETNNARGANIQMQSMFLVFSSSSLAFQSMGWSLRSRPRRAQASLARSMS